MSALRLLRPDRRRLSAADGAAMVELALTLPLLVVVLLGAADFARLFYRSIELTNAARAGAQYGAQSPAKSADTAGMKSAAVTASPNIPSFTTSDVSAARTCQCASDAGVFSATSPANNCNYDCSTGHLVTTVTVTASKSFTTISAYPGMPRTINLVSSAAFRLP